MNVLLRNAFGWCVTMLLIVYDCLALSKTSFAYLYYEIDCD